MFLYISEALYMRLPSLQLKAEEAKNEEEEDTGIQFPPHSLLLFFRPIFHKVGCIILGRIISALETYLLLSY